MQATSAGFCYLIRAAAAACEKGDEREEVDNDFDKIKVVQISKTKPKRRDVTFSDFSLTLANSTLSPPYTSIGAPFPDFSFLRRQRLAGSEKNRVWWFSPPIPPLPSISPPFSLLPHAVATKKRKTWIARGRRMMPSAAAAARSGPRVEQMPFVACRPAAERFPSSFIALPRPRRWRRRRRGGGGQRRICELPTAKRGPRRLRIPLSLPAGLVKPRHLSDFA